MFLRQSTCTSQGNYMYMKTTFLSPQSKVELKIWKTSQNLRRTKFKKRFSVKISHQAKEQAHPTNIQLGRFVPSWRHFSLSDEKIVISSVCTEKLHIPFSNIVKFQCNKRKTKNKSYSLYCLTWCLCKENNMKSMHSSIKY
jgi:hypothetical protein